MKSHAITLNCIVILALLLALFLSWNFVIFASAPPKPPVLRINLSCLPDNISVMGPECKKCPDLTCNYPSLDAPLLVKDVWAIKEAHRIDKNPDKPYVCRHVTRDIFDRLKSDGYESVLVCHNRGETHAWIKYGDMIIDGYYDNPFIDPKDWDGYNNGSKCHDYVPDWWFHGE